MENNTCTLSTPIANTNTDSVESHETKEFIDDSTINYTLRDCIIVRKAYGKKYIKINNDLIKEKIPIYNCYEDIFSANEYVGCKNVLARTELKYHDIVFCDLDTQKKNKIFISVDPIKLQTKGFMPKNHKMKLFVPETDAEKISFLKQQGKLRIRLDANQESCVDLRKFIESVDAWASSEDTKKKLFGHCYRKYQFCPSIKKRSFDFCEFDNDDNNKKRPDEYFINMSFNLELPENDTQYVNNTIIIKRIGNTGHQIDITDINDLDDILVYNTCISFIFCCDQISVFGSIWDGYMYSVCYTVCELVYEPYERFTLKLSPFHFDTDSDSDSDSDSDLDKRPWSKRNYNFGKFDSSGFVLS